MKQIAIVALAAGALVLGLTGCGSDKSTDASELRKETSTSAAVKSAAPIASTPAAAPVEPPTAAPASTAAVKQTTAPNGAKTTCGEFRNLDGDTEKQVIQQVLAANPGSKFDGSPNVALGTAKLACLASAYTDTPVANAIGATK
ncbi:hypothetical protein AB0L82_40270 [Nocardia sp. NPDC052001]|uniref:hypothetical protein n=1 Tax=Nocardia sp. NPDC052001 TaxID=3154853 RepID=UPI00344052AD